MYEYVFASLLALAATLARAAARENLCGEVETETLVDERLRGNVSGEVDAGSLMESACVNVTM